MDGRPTGGGAEVQIFPPELIEAIARSASPTPAAIEAVFRHIERDLRLSGGTRLLYIAPAIAVAAKTGKRAQMIQNEPTLWARAEKIVSEADRV